MTKQRAYLDTEFTSLNRYTRRLISLALVVPGGPEFYVEVSDSWQEHDCSDFVREVVLPLLDLSTYGRTTEQARTELLTFLVSLGAVEVFSDALDWDWPLLLWLIGAEGLPIGVEARQISGDVEAVYGGECPPHHALLDARLLAKLLDAKLHHP